jgi:hypothetical protein
MPAFQWASGSDFQGGIRILTTAVRIHILIHTTGTTDRTTVTMGHPFTGTTGTATRAIATGDKLNGKAFLGWRMLIIPPAYFFR